MSKTNVNIILLLLLFPLYRLWHAFDATMISPWLERGFYFPIESRWYFKFLSESVGWIIAAIVIVRMARMRLWLEVVAVVWLVYRFYDLVMFLYNFNRSYDYVVAYSAAGLIAFVFYLYRTQVLKLKGLQDFYKRKIRKNHHAI